MSRVSRSRRRESLRLIREASRSGRIAQVDADLRSSAVRNATDDQEIEILVRDLRDRRYATYHPPADPVSEDHLDAPVIHRQRVVDVVAAPAAGRPIRTTVALVLVVVSVCVVGVSMTMQFLSDDDVPAVTVPESETEPVDHLQDDALQALLASYYETFGTTETFQVAVHTDSVSVQVPVDATTKRYQDWYWLDGEWQTSDGAKGTSSDTRVDLASFDVAGVLDLVPQTAALVDGESSAMVLVNRREQGDAPVVVYASNEFDETAWIKARLDGTVIEVNPPTVHD